MPQDSKAAFKGEWEALEMTEHTWALKNSDQVRKTVINLNKRFHLSLLYFKEMMSLVGPTPDNLYHQSRSCS